MTFDRLPDLDNANVGKCFFTFFSGDTGSCISFFIAKIRPKYMIYKFYSLRIYFRRITMEESNIKKLSISGLA